MQSKREKTNRMTMAKASVDDVIVLTYDVTACMCVNVHESVFICVPVCVTLSVSSSSQECRTSFLTKRSGRVFSSRGRFKDPSLRVHINLKFEKRPVVIQLKGRTKRDIDQSQLLSCRATFTKARTFKMFVNYRRPILCQVFGI